VTDDKWQSGDAYERYMGRWGRLLAREFVLWLDFSGPGTWLDLGCGTGALSQAILELAQPERIIGLDPTPGFVAQARQQMPSNRSAFLQGNAVRLPFAGCKLAVVVSGLALNFMPEAALDEMQRVLQPGAVLAAYVWDYAGEMQWLRYFWDAALDLDPEADRFDEGQRFPLCHPARLSELFAGHGLREIRTSAIEIATHFVSFEDYWEPFLCRQFPAQYVARLSENQRDALRETLRQRLPTNADGSIDLLARAWAVAGIGGS
jgi:SAM-dependent methyltransferase